MTRSDLWDLLERVWLSLDGEPVYITYMRENARLPTAIRDVAIRMFTHGSCQCCEAAVIRHQILFMDTHGLFDVDSGDNATQNFHTVPSGHADKPSKPEETAA